MEPRGSMGKRNLALDRPTDNRTYRAASLKLKILEYYSAFKTRGRLACFSLSIVGRNFKLKTSLRAEKRTISNQSYFTLQFSNSLHIYFFYYCTKQNFCQVRIDHDTDKMGKRITRKERGYYKVKMVRQFLYV